MDFAELYGKYSGDVYRFALYLSGDAGWAEDLTAETFARVWVSPEPVRVATVRAYLFTIARNLFLQEQRTRRRQEVIDVSMPAAGVDPETGAAQRAELRSVLDALATLAEVDRSALILRAVDGLAYEEIAATLGLPVSTVKVKIHRARLKLAALRHGKEKSTCK